MAESEFFKAVWFLMSDLACCRKKRESALFYELGHTAYNSFKKNITKGQILLKAKQEIEHLKQEAARLEKEKQVSNDPWSKSIRVNILIATNSISMEQPPGLGRSEKNEIFKFFME